MCRDRWKNEGFRLLMGESQTRLGLVGFRRHLYICFCMCRRSRGGTRSSNRPCSLLQVRSWSLSWQMAIMRLDVVSFSVEDDDGGTADRVIICAALKHAGGGRRW